jgi:hypothetical protein
MPADKLQHSWVSAGHILSASQPLAACWHMTTNMNETSQRARPKDPAQGWNTQREAEGPNVGSSNATGSRTTLREAGRPNVGWKR